MSAPAERQTEATNYLDRERVAAFLNALPFVHWDRFTQTVDELVVYGWIDRDDAHADFVLMQFAVDGSVGWTTSSAKWSRPISVALLGDDDGHVDCQRVEAEFGQLVANAIRRESA